MQPTDHMKPSGGELIAHIKESLADYEEPYVPGSWEKFNTGKRNKKGLIVRMKGLSSAAAVLLIGVGFFLLINRTGSEDAFQISDVKKSKGSDPSYAFKENNEKTGGSNVELSKINTPNSLSSLPANDHAAQPNSEILADVGMEPRIHAGIQPDRVFAALDQPISDRKPATDKEAPSNITKISFADFLANESESATPDKKTGLAKPNDDKWDLGLVVSPSYGHSKKLTMGYGVSMGYALTDKISFRSGISYNEMAALKSFEPPETATLVNGRNLESAEANLTGLDIPLEIKYNLSKYIYANLGVSAFAVLDQNRSNTYVEARLVERAVPTTGGTQEMRTFVETHRTIENVPDSEIKNEDFLGLYNFSFGYKHKISKNKALSIEPFIKMPMKEVTNENLRLIATGLRLRFEL